MAIPFKTVKLGNPSDASKPKKYYAKSLIGSAHTSLEQMAKTIALRSSLSAGTVIHVITELEALTLELLEAGHTVQFGGIGSLYLSVKSLGYAAAKQVTAACIRQVKILFRASKETKRRLKSMSACKKTA